MTKKCGMYISSKNDVPSLKNFWNFALLSIRSDSDILSKFIIFSSFLKKLINSENVHVWIFYHLACFIRLTVAFVFTLHANSSPRDLFSAMKFASLYGFTRTSSSIFSKTGIFRVEPFRTSTKNIILKVFKVKFRYVSRKSEIGKKFAHVKELAVRK